MWATRSNLETVGSKPRPVARAGAGVLLAIVVFATAVLATAGCGGSSTRITPAEVDAGADVKLGVKSDAGSDAIADADAGAAGDRGSAPGDAAADAGTGAPDAGAVDSGAPELADAGIDGDAGSDGDAGDAAGGHAGSDAGAGRPEILVVATYLGGISSFRLDPVSGAPAPATTSLDAGAQLYAVTAHPSGDFVYAADFRGRIYGYRVNRSDGSLAALPGMPLIIGGQAITAAIDPQGRFLYVGNSGDNALYAYVIDVASGALNPVMGSPFMLDAAPAGVCFHPAGGFAYVSSIALSATGQGGIRVFSVDPVSGVPHQIDGSPFATSIFGGALAVHPNGNFLFDGSFGLHVLAIDPTTRGVHELADSPRAGAQSDNSAVDIALDPLGQYLYASDNTGKVTGYRVDATTAAFGPVDGSPYDLLPFPYSVAIDPTGRFVFVGNDDVDEVAVYSLQRASGKLESIMHMPLPALSLQPEMVVIGS